jgi:hypothetical protein
MNKPELIDDGQLASKLENCPAERVTKKGIESRIVSTEFHRIGGGTVTIASIALDNGFSVRGESACVNPENYDQQIGERIAYDNAFAKLWPLFGFALAERNFQNGGPVKAEAA